MEGIALFVSIVIIVFGVLQIILFFKLWGMTNNVSEMKNMIELIMRQNLQKKNQLKPEMGNDNNDIKIEDLVVELKNERQLKVVNITDDGKFECILPGGITPIGSFYRNEIELFNKYWDKK